MKFSCRVVEDSIAPSGKRLTTIEATYPRIIHSEVLTHRDRARNAASSRAIPWKKMMERILTAPFIPIRWGSEQRGMQTGGEVCSADQERAKKIWLRARDQMVTAAAELAELGIHKSICNRLTEPWMWITVIMTATEWRNFFRLRCHEDAEIHFQEIANLIRVTINSSKPVPREVGEWHLPYITAEERASDMPIDTLCQMSTARAARVSYLTHDGVPSVAKDMDLFEKLVAGSGFGHWSPHEHAARAMSVTGLTLPRSGPFVGWEQYRKTFLGRENLEG